MALSNAYVQGYGKIRELFKKIRDGQAPEQFTHQLLKDWGLSSSNDRQFIQLLKALGFLSPDGKPSSRYHDYRDHSRSKQVMGEAIREAYGDIFLIKSSPSKEDNEVRTFIRETLEEKDGADWLNKLPPKIWEHAKGRREAALKDSWLEGEKTDLLGFLEFGHLAQIMSNKREHFQDIIPSQHWLKQRMDELEKVRHFIAHNRMLLPSEF